MGCGAGGASVNGNSSGGSGSPGYCLVITRF